MKMHNLKSKKAKGKDAVPESDGGMRIHLDHDHLSKMNLADGSLKVGGKVHFAGEGTVEHASADTYSGQEPRHSVGIRLHKAGVDYEGGERDSEEDRKGLRAELEKAAK